MSDLRTAAQQALEALDAATSCIDGYYVPRGKTTLPEIEEAQKALRTALAQQDEPGQEPVGYLPTYELNRLQSGHDGRLRSAKFGPSSLDEDVALYTAPPQRLPQTIDESMQQPRAMAQAYENGYKAGVAHEREACEKACEHQPHWVACAAAIRARGNT